MDITFKYNGKIISTPNLEKKLKRMKISLNDIEIIEKEIKKEEPIEEDDYELVNLITPLDNIKHCVRVLKGTRPNIYELLKQHIWNPNTKTGIKYMTNDFIKTLTYET